MQTKSYLLKRCSFVAVIILLMPELASQGRAQTREDVEKVRTRVVSVSALVVDKRTNEPLNDLKAENFEVFADGKKRPLTYFARGNDPRNRPLALILMMDISPGAAGRFFKEKEFADSLIAPLSQLPPQDEVAIMTYSVLIRKEEATNSYRELLPLTSDKEKIAATLRTIPELVLPHYYDMSKEERRNVQFNTRFTKDVVDKFTRSAITDRPDSQVVAIAVGTDFNGFDTMTASSLGETLREQLTSQMLRANVVYNSLIFDKTLLIKSFLIAMTPLTAAYHIRVTGDDKYFAEKTGGEALRVNTPEEMAEGLKQIVGNLTARYSLGFTLAENEKNDGRLHRLEVKVKARDARGKERKVIVYARRGYYLPKETEAK